MSRRRFGIKGKESILEVGNIYNPGSEGILSEGLLAGARLSLMINGSTQNITWDQFKTYKLPEGVYWVSWTFYREIISPYTIKTVYIKYTKLPNTNCAGFLSALPVEQNFRLMFNGLQYIDGNLVNFYFNYYFPNGYHIKLV